MRIHCPICKKQIPDAPADFGPRPFCSERCKRIDLGNWLDGRYCISSPLQPEDIEDDEFQQH